MVDSDQRGGVIPEEFQRIPREDGAHAIRAARAPHFEIFHRAPERHSPSSPAALTPEGRASIFSGQKTPTVFRIFGAGPSKRPCEALRVGHPGGAGDLAIPAALSATGMRLGLADPPRRPGANAARASFRKSAKGNRPCPGRRPGDPTAVKHQNSLF